MLWLSSAALPAAGDDGVIRGIVRSDAGPEAGVWVIAATSDLETVYRKIVVTGDDGLFLVPDLPDATYEVWARGYGLTDSAAVAARPGDEVELLPAVAADPRDAASIYPAKLLVRLARGFRTPASFPAPARAATASAARCATRPTGSTA